MTDTTPGPDDMHVGRSWSGTRLEADCPCPKAPCGLVRSGDADPACMEHPATRAKSMRQMHAESRCPAVAS